MKMISSWVFKATIC